MRNHNASVHEKKKTFNCVICGFDFSMKAALEAHISALHNGKKPYKCLICEISFAYKQGLTKHTANKHEEKELEKLENVLFVIRVLINIA